MIPQRFAQSNRVMKRPAGMTEGQCVDVHAYCDGEHVITAWRPTPEELVRINLGEFVYLHVVGPSMPPVALLVGEESVFMVPENQQPKEEQ